MEPPGAPSAAVREQLPAPLPPGHRAEGPRLPTVAAVDLVGAFLAGRKPTTLRAYRADLDDFARFVGVEGARPAVEFLISGTAGQANAVALGYKADLIARGLSAATVARRLAALRSMVKLARTVGRIGWALEIEAPRVEGLRDIAGPGRGGLRSMIDAAAGDSPKAVRDRAIVRTLHDLGLRRGELIGLDLADLDTEGSRLAVLGKGRAAREWMTVPRPTPEVIRAWLAVRGPGPGPLFHRLNLAAGDGPPSRLNGESVRRIVRGLGRRAGLARDVRPHGLRHLAIPTALDLTGGDVRTVQRFSRHKKLDVLMVYDDRRKDAGGSVARLIAGEG
jgi:integrase/recombinase XerC